MNQTRYCSTCGALLSQGAAICGECGARYQESPYERRATDAPGAWSQAPRARSRDLGQEQESAEQDTGIELISREALQPKAPGATALRPPEQYDQMMVTQPPSNVSATGPGSSALSQNGSYAAGDASGASEDTAQQMEPPLDGCVPASPLKRFLAALLDSVIATLVLIPLAIGLILVITQDSVSILATILVGAGAALRAAYSVLMIWLHGAKGFTLGKLIMGLRTTRFCEGGPIGVLRSLGRWFVYGLAPLIMVLSIFLDPKKLLRGFHDRVIDSVVVDAKAGRNPMNPRADDFERQSAEHYLGEPSVAVTTHDNLLASPGSAWAEQTDASAPSASPQGEQQTGGWGTGSAEPSQFAPPVQDVQQPVEHGWAAPEIHIVAQPSPAPAPAQNPPAKPHVPDEHTTDAWDNVDVDEETRSVLVGDSELGDLEETRVSAIAPKKPTLTLRADDGQERVVTDPVVIGRNPSAGEGEVKFVLSDDTRSMSKTHLRLDGTGSEVTVTDLGSTNGSAIVQPDGSRESLVPNTPTALPDGAGLALGDRTLTVERDS